MQAVILAGGKGTRLRPLTMHTPKPVVPICNRPFLVYQLEMLRRAGITDVTLALNYQPNKIEHLLGDGAKYGVRLRYVVEPQPMGTAGAFKFAQEFIQAPTVVLNGDVLTDLDLKNMIREHTERAATATIVLQPVDNPTAYGLVETETDGRIRRFLEKPKPEEITTNNINAGTYILEPQILDYIPIGENHSFEYGLFPQLLARGEKFFAHVPPRTYWLDLGTPERYWQGHDDLLNNRVTRFRLKERRGACEISDAAQVDALSMIADDCTLKAGAEIINSVLGQGCIVEEGARVENSVIWAHTRISANAAVSYALIGRGCHIGRNAHVGCGAVIGDKTSLTDYTICGGGLTV